jgi:hypothetical protein
MNALHRLIGALRRFGTRRGRSVRRVDATRPIWIWNQALAAIARAITHDRAVHPVVAVRTVIIGWVLCALRDRERHLGCWRSAAAC